MILQPTRWGMVVEDGNSCKCVFARSGGSLGLVVKSHLQEAPQTKGLFFCLRPGIIIIQAPVI